jgi:hypothetical protein
MIGIGYGLFQGAMHVEIEENQENIQNSPTFRPRIKPCTSRTQGTSDGPVCSKRGTKEVWNNSSLESNPVPQEHKARVHGKRENQISLEQQ